MGDLVVGEVVSMEWWCMEDWRREGASKEKSRNSDVEAMVAAEEEDDQAGEQRDVLVRMGVSRC